MKDWLLKEEKTKVGRPKLADNKVLKRAYALIALSMLTCIIMSFFFVCKLKNVSPIDYAYSLTLEKLVGMRENPNGFLIKEYYDDDYNYVMEVKVTDKVDSYSGSYRYTTYYLSGGKWIKKESKDFPVETKSFKIKFDSKKNNNVTWKVILQITNASEIERSYAPSSWKFIDANSPKDMYAYKVFTVKGYYSPVALSEINEAKKEKDKVVISTSKENPRKFDSNLPGGYYDVNVRYTDVNGKQIVLANDKNVAQKVSYEVPNLDRSTKVTFKIYSNNNNLKDRILSNWKLDSDKNGKEHATISYILKPEKSYSY